MADNRAVGAEELAAIRDEVHRALRSAYDRLIAFASTPEFQALLDELYSLPPAQRPGFVNDVVLNDSALRARGIGVPTGILIQRSSFGDRRPTLFCIKQYLPERLQIWWHNANLTFDNLVPDDSVPSDRRAWRPPLEFDAQQALVAGLIDEASLDCSPPS